VETLKEWKEVITRPCTLSKEARKDWGFSSSKDSLETVFVNGIIWLSYVILVLCGAQSTLINPKAVLWAVYLAVFVLTLWPGKLLLKECHCADIRRVQKTTKGENLNLWTVTKQSKSKFYRQKCLWTGKRNFLLYLLSFYSNNCPMKLSAKCNYLKYSGSSLHQYRFSMNFFSF
jgi:hypothetical protein